MVKFYTWEVSNARDMITITISSISEESNNSHAFLFCIYTTFSMYYVQFIYNSWLCHSNTIGLVA